MLEAYLLLNGRLGRLAYFGYSMLMGVIITLLLLFLIIPARNSPHPQMALIAGMVIVSAVALWFGIALSVKRLHDIDLSGWHYLWMALVPGLIQGAGEAMHTQVLTIFGGLVGLGVGLFLLFWPGTSGPNRYD